MNGKRSNMQRCLFYNRKTNKSLRKGTQLLRMMRFKNVSVCIINLRAFIHIVKTNKIVNNDIHFSIYKFILNECRRSTEQPISAKESLCVSS